MAETRAAAGEGPNFSSVAFQASNCEVFAVLSSSRKVANRTSAL